MNEELIALAQQLKANQGTKSTKITTDDYDKFVVLFDDSVVFSQLDALKTDKLPEESREAITALRQLVIEALESIGFEVRQKGQSTAPQADAVKAAMAKLEALKKLGN